MARGASRRPRGLIRSSPLPRTYLDTSAYLAVLLGESGADKVQFATHKRALCASTLLLIEAERNLVRLSRNRILSANLFNLATQQLQQDRELFILRDLTADLCLTGAYPIIRTPRSSDLVHLRTAQWFRENGGLDNFVTLDSEQRKADIELGFNCPEC